MYKANDLVWMSSFGGNLNFFGNLLLTNMQAMVVLCFGRIVCSLFYLEEGKHECLGVGLNLEVHD